MIFNDNKPMKLQRELHRKHVEKNHYELVPTTTKSSTTRMSVTIAIGVAIIRLKNHSRIE